MDISNIVNIFEGACFYSNVTKVINPESLRNIGQNAFRECKELETFPFGNAKDLQEIARGAFANCEALTSELVLPLSMERLGDIAFRGCKKLPSISIQTDPEANPRIRQLGKGCFHGCTNGALPEKAPPLQLGKGCFHGCTNLKTVNLSCANRLTIIPKGAFSECSQLEKIVLPKSIERLEDAAFKDCRTLGQIDLSCATGLVSISKSAFSGCSQLKEVVFPNSIKRIEKDAFRCKPRDKVPSDDKSIGPIIFLPASLRIIEGEAFAGRRSWSFVVDEKNPIYSTCYPLPQGNADPDPTSLISLRAHVFTAILPK